ncbi:MAG: outer membrane beta-barrel protein [Bacteroidetes bacterium]|nr:outer membrane beta-barrel protein [Bacteroidota bacterium]
MFKIIRFIYFLFIVLTATDSIAQDTIPKVEGDLKYREDQFYIGVTYNLLSAVPAGVNPEGLTGGVNFGFLRDMPINKNRNIAVAVGLGIALDRYGNNMLIEKDVTGNTTYTILDSDVSFKSNNLKTGIIELPIEFRWRSSTPTTYKFWRVYAGFRLGYTFWNESSFKDSSNNITHSDIEEFEKLRLATTLSLGFNKFNFFVYYTLNPFFNENAITTTGQKVNFQTLKLGLMFYIL